MTIWIPDVEGRKGPLYLALADAIGEAVRDGGLASGMRLPPQREMAYRLGVTLGTVTRAYGEARRRGLVVGEVGRGTFVRREDDSPPGDRRESDANLLHGIFPREGADNLVDLGPNFPALAGTERLMSEALAHIGRHADLSELVRYQPFGMPRHREVGARWLASGGIDAPPDRVLICNGAQHGLSVVLTAMANPGDVVLAEALAYPGIKAIAAHLGLRLEGVPMDDEGMRPDALEEICRRSLPKLVCCVPTIQNPTTAVMSESRRRAIADIARRHDVLIVEDGLYGYLIDDRLPAIAALAPERTFHINGLSKVSAPGLRVGYVLTPRGTTERILAAIQMSHWMTAPLMAEIATLWIEDGTIETLEQWHRAEARSLRRLADSLLGRALTAGSHPASYFLWLALPEPWRADEFVDQLRRQGVNVAAASVFAVGRESAPPAIRVSLGAARDRPSLERALRIIDTSLKQPPSPVAPVM